MSTYERFVIALAAPAARVSGADERVLGGGVAPERARDLLRRLFAVEGADDIRALLAYHAAHGQRAEWNQYRHHAGGAWKPEPRDTSVVRKAEHAVAHGALLGARGLVAVDATRSAAIAGWSVAAGILTVDQALVAVGDALVQLAARSHASWQDFAAQLIAGYAFAFPTVDPDVRAAVAALVDGPGIWADTAWPDEPTIATLRAPHAPDPVKDDDDGDDDADGGDDDACDDEPAAAAALSITPLSTLSIQLSLDCPGCGLPIHVEQIADRARCGRCGTELALDADDWTYFLASDAAARRRRRGRGEDDPITNDFGARFFSRRDVRRADQPRCVCGAALPSPTAPGELRCDACGRAARVRAADPLVRAIAARARLVVETARGPARDAPAAVACAACEASIAIAAAPTSRIVDCPRCAARTFVPDAAWAAWHGPAARAAIFVLCAW